MQPVNKITARKKMNLNLNDRIIFITGGSQGSRPINQHFLKNYRKYLESGIQIIWQCGKWDYDQLNISIDEKQIHLYEFVTDMNLCYAAADVVVARAGAITISEITACGKPAVLIPLPHAAGDHQTKNARFLSKNNAAIMVHQSEMVSGRLEDELNSLLSNTAQLSEIEKNAFALSKPEATQNIVEEVLKLS